MGGRAALVTAGREPVEPAVEDPPVPPLPLDVEEFLTWLSAERGRSANTLAAYRRDLRAFWAWSWHRGLGLDAVGPGELDAYVGHLRGRGLAPSSVARAMVAVRSLYRFRTEEGLADNDPSAAVESPRVPAGLPKALTEAEIGALLDAVTGDDAVARRDRALVEVLYGTGARISEACGLRLGDVDLDGSLVRLFGKGAKERVVPLGRMARLALADWLAPGGRPEMAPEQWKRRGDAEAVFLNQRGGRLGRQGAWSIVRGHGDAAGLGERLTPHVLRHSCATHMLDHGADIRAVQELLGHASISTTQVYTLISTDRLFAAYDAAHPRARRGAPS
ncbi:site-specific tyrosine recombinase [Rhabdothermincola salaria]|uniref:site-specific tyrosine recombinase n=1 Tax=Rhabdothermincola salaria TaxID=2903142 RepID=UPI001E4D78F1|nr:tyrosine recombinase XerD [Rhabdothermincola salaria]